jgi:hypothetical protein
VVLVYLFLQTQQRTKISRGTAYLTVASGTAYLTVAAADKYNLKNARRY